MHALPREVRPNGLATTKGWRLNCTECSDAEQGATEPQSRGVRRRHHRVYIFAYLWWHGDSVTIQARPTQNRVLAHARQCYCTS